MGPARKCGLFLFHLWSRFIAWKLVEVGYVEYRNYMIVGKGIGDWALGIRDWAFALFLTSLLQIGYLREW